jgi:hypothetical protein
MKMKENDALRVKRYRKAFGDEEGVNELTDEEVLKRINLEKAFYCAKSVWIEQRIKQLETM